MDLLRNARYNKGLAFTDEERERHYLNGLLPPAVETQELQVSLENECLQKFDLHQFYSGHASSSLGSWKMEEGVMFKDRATARSLLMKA